MTVGTRQCIDLIFLILVAKAESCAFLLFAKNKTRDFPSLSHRCSRVELQGNRLQPTFELADCERRRVGFEKDPKRIIWGEKIILKNQARHFRHLFGHPHALGEEETKSQILAKAAAAELHLDLYFAERGTESGHGLREMLSHGIAVFRSAFEVRDQGQIP